jgi:predicted nucleotidyltransferase
MPVTKEIEQLAVEMKMILQNLYGSRLDKIILYGSYARGDFRNDSDIDFMLLLNDESVNTFREITNLSPYISDLNLKYGKIISFTPVSTQRYQTRNIPVYVNIRNEGIEI